MVERHQDIESYMCTNTPLKIINSGGRHRKVASEFNAKSMMAKQQLMQTNNGAISQNQQKSMKGNHVHLNSMIEEQLQSQITQNLLKNNQPNRFQSPKVKKYIQDKQQVSQPSQIQTQNQEKQYMKLNMITQNSSCSQSNGIRRNLPLTNSTISGLEASLPNGATYDRTNENKSRNIRKESTFTDTNGVVKNMSMLNSYDHKDSKGELKVEMSNATSVKAGNLKKISIDIKPKQSHQIIQNQRNENIKVTSHNMNIRHIESSRSSSYNEMDEHDNTSLSKSINLEDSKERQHELDHQEDEQQNPTYQAIKTMEISRSKYEGKALKSKRGSTKMNKNKQGESKGIIGKLQNKCKVLTNTSSKESCQVDQNKLTIDEGNNSYLSVIGLNGHINKILQSPKNQKENGKYQAQMFKNHCQQQSQMIQQNTQRQALQAQMKHRNHPQYFMTFQQNEQNRIMPQIGPSVKGQKQNSVGTSESKQNLSTALQMNQTLQEEQINQGEFQKYSMFNNYAYQNIINQNPSQLFKKGNDIHQSKIDGQSENLFQPSLMTQSSVKKHQILKKIQKQKTLQPTIITSPESLQNKQFPPLSIGEEQLLEKQYHNRALQNKYNFNQIRMQQSKLPDIQGQIDKAENIQYQKLFQQYLLNQEKWIQVLQSQLGLQKPGQVNQAGSKNSSQINGRRPQANPDPAIFHQDMDVPQQDQSFWQKLLQQQNEYAGQQAQQKSRTQNNSKQISIERVNNQIAHNQQAQQQNMFMNGLCGYSLNQIIQTYQESKVHNEDRQPNSSLVSPQEQVSAQDIEQQMKQYQYSFQKEQARLRREQRKINIQNRNFEDSQRNRLNKSPMQKTKAATAPEMPPTNMTIHHPFDSSLHFNHKTNIVIRNINSVIRLIFKNTKDQAAITAINPGNSIHQMQTYIDDHRIKEIQKIANTMKVNIPRRFDSKTAIREYIQSREFITAMKQSISQQLFQVINISNGTMELIQAKQLKIAKFYDKKEVLKKQEREFYNSHQPQKQPQSSGFAATTPRYLSPQKKPSQAPMMLPEKKIKKNFSPRKTNKQFNKKQESEEITEVNEDYGTPVDKVKTPIKGSKKESAQKVTRKAQKKLEKEAQLQASIKQKQEEEMLKKQIEEKIEEEKFRREEEELDPLKKEDRIKIEKQLIDQREKLKEKEKLLQFNQKFSIGYGNNYQIVKSVLKHRSWWHPAQNEDFDDANFIWTSWKRDKHIDYLKENGQMDINQPIKIYGRMDNNKQLTNKKGIFINMREYYNASGIDPFSILPITYLAKHAGDSEFQKFEKKYNLIAQQLQDSQTNCKIEIKEYKQSKKKQILKEIADKSKFSSVDDSQSEDEMDILDSYENSEIRAIKEKHRGPLNTWIIKPGENTNRGVGISVSRDINEIKGLICGGKTKDGGDSTYIIQKYIDYPLLIHKRKFDFRVYSLVTSINKKLKGYFYEDGYIRTSSREYDLNALDDKFIHLTNDAIQKQDEDFGKFENFNKMSYGDFQRYLNTYHEDLNVNVQHHIIPQIKKLITDTIRAASFKLDSKRLLNSFEILGYDFMLDENFKLSLIEVNTNPCLETESPLLSRIIPELIENTFKIVLDPLFPSPDMQTNKKLLVNELPLEIKYSLIFDEEIDAAEVRELYEKYNIENKTFYMLDQNEKGEDKIESDPEESEPEEDD